MSNNENNELLKTMLKCGLQLLMFAGVLAIIVVIAKVTSFYAANIWNAVLFVNNLFLPSKHFIQDNIWYFVAPLGVFVLWLMCVFAKTPKEHVKSLIILTKILAGVLVCGEILLLCVADMNEGGLSAVLFLFSFMFLVAICAFMHDLITQIANTKLKLIKENQ
jgi:hypothetical protein